MMSNVIQFNDGKREDCTKTAPEQLGINEYESLLEGWRSIARSLAQLQSYLNDLTLNLDAFPDGPQKSHVGLLLKQAEIQVQNSLIRSTEASAAVARINEQRV